MGNQSRYKKHKKAPRTKNKLSFKDKGMRARFCLGLAVWAGAEVNLDELNLEKFAFASKDAAKKFVLGCAVASALGNAYGNVKLARHIQNEYIGEPAVGIEQIVTAENELHEKQEDFLEDLGFDIQKKKEEEIRRSTMTAEQYSEDQKKTRKAARKAIAAREKEAAIKKEAEKKKKAEKKNTNAGTDDKGSKPNGKGTNPNGKRPKSGRTKDRRFSLWHMLIFGGSLLWNILMYFFADVSGFIEHLLWVGSMMIPYIVIVALLRLFPKLRSKIGGIISTVIFAMLTLLLIPMYVLLSIVFYVVVAAYFALVIMNVMPNTLTITWEHEDGTTTTETRIIGDDVGSEIRAVEREAQSKGYHRKD